MRQSSKALLSAAGLLAIALTVYLVATRPGPTDSELIAGQIDTLVDAISHRSARGVMRVVSASYADAYFRDVDQLHYAVMRTFNQSGPIRITTSTRQITLSGDTAVVKLHVHAMADINSAPLDQDVILHWKKEPGHRWLFFPTADWQLVSADYSVGGFGFD